MRAALALAPLALVLAGCLDAPGETAQASAGGCPDDARGAHATVELAAATNVTLRAWPEMPQVSTPGEAKCLLRMMTGYVHAWDGARYDHLFGDMRLEHATRLADGAVGETWNVTLEGRRDGLAPDTYRARIEVSRGIAIITRDHDELRGLPQDRIDAARAKLEAHPAWAARTHEFAPAATRWADGGVVWLAYGSERVSVRP